MSYLAGKKDRPLINSIGFVIGFTLIFVMLGAFAGTVGSFFAEYRMAVNIVTGLFVIILGLSYLGVFNLRLPNGAGIMQRVAVKPLTFTTSIVFGMVFSIAWTPCVSAFLGTALLRASQQGSVIEGMFMLFVFSMGLGLPFIASAVLVDRLKGTFDFIKKHYRIVNAIAGIMLVMVGIFMMIGMFERFITLFA